MIIKPLSAGLAFAAILQCVVANVIYKLEKNQYALIDNDIQLFNAICEDFQTNSAAYASILKEEDYPTPLFSSFFHDREYLKQIYNNQQLSSEYSYVEGISSFMTGLNPDLISYLTSKAHANSVYIDNLSNFDIPVTKDTDDTSETDTDKVSPTVKMSTIAGTSSCKDKDKYCTSFESTESSSLEITATSASSSSSTTTNNWSSESSNSASSDISSSFSSSASSNSSSSSLSDFSSLSASSTSQSITCPTIMTSVTFSNQSIPFKLEYETSGYIQPVAQAFMEDYSLNSTRYRNLMSENKADWQGYLSFIKTQTNNQEVLDMSLNDLKTYYQETIYRQVSQYAFKLTWFDELMDKAALYFVLKMVNDYYYQGLANDSVLENTVGSLNRCGIECIDYDDALLNLVTNCFYGDEGFVNLYEGVQGI